MLLVVLLQINVGCLGNRNWFWVGESGFGTVVAGVLFVWKLSTADHGPWKLPLKVDTRQYIFDAKGTLIRRNVSVKAVSLLKMEVIALLVPI